MKGISRRNIHVYTILIFSMQIDMETKKQTENFLMLNAIIPKACKKWSRNGNSQLFKKIYYWLLWILWLPILKDLLALTFVIAVTETYFLHPVLFCRLWIFCYFGKILKFMCAFKFMWHWFLNLKGHLKLIENYNHYCCWYQCYYKGHFYQYLHIVIIAELTELHQLILIASFLFRLLVNVHIGKLK